MSRIIYPLKRAIKLAKDIADFGQQHHPNVFNDPNFHGMEYLKDRCAQMGVYIVSGKDLPGAKRKAVVMDVKGTPFIVLDKSLEARRGRLICALAHELGHIMLGHFARLNFCVLGFSETSNEWDARLQAIYCAETELEADLIAMMLILPDSYLHSIVEKTIFIPAQKKAHEHGLDTNWVAARIQLYREMYGYERSKELLLKRHKDEFSKPDLEKWFSLERRDNNCLRSVMPEIDPGMFSYLRPTFAREA